MKNTPEKFTAQMEAILKDCREMREGIQKCQAEQDRLFEEFDMHILPKIQTAGPDHGSR